MIPAGSEKPAPPVRPLPSAIDELPPARTAVPRWLFTGGAWSWRLIVIGVVAYYILRFILHVELVVLPFLGAMVFTALLRPLVRRLQAVGMHRLGATWLTFLVALIVVLGAGTFVVYRATVEWHTLVNDMSSTSDKLRHWLSTGPLHLKDTNLKDLQKKAVSAINQHRSTILSGVYHGASILGEALAGIVLTAFITFFLLYDGERVWRFVTSPIRPQNRARLDRAADAAWHTLSGYIRGSVIIASFHAVVMGIALAVIGVPLVAPLALLVFVTSFIPLVGVLIGGGLSVFVTMGTHGVTAGVALLIVLIIEHQIEGHFLQPFVMSRYVRIHPLAVALALTTGSILEGVVGAIIAVPLVAMIYAVWPHLRQSELAPPVDPPPPAGHVLLGERQN